MRTQPFWPLLYGEAQQAFQPAPETLGLGAFLQQRLGFHPQHLALQGLALVLVRWPPVLLVPAAGKLPSAAFLGSRLTMTMPSCRTTRNSGRLA